MQYFSGFSGIGGFDLGIERNIPDAECVGYSEVDKYAIKIYEKHFPDRTNYGDIRRIDAGTLPDFDMFCGGFPCQDLSIAGKRAGLCGTRSGLFFEIIRIIREKQPRLVFLENVKGLFSSNNGWDFARILLELDESGYDVEWQCLNSKNFGVPQNRERVFIIGHLRGIPWKSVFPIREDIERIDERAEQTTNVRTLTAGGHSGGLHSSMTLLQVAGDNQGNRVYSPDGLSKCLCNGGGQGAKTGLYVISDSGQGRKSQLRIENIAPLRANTGASHNNVVVQRTPLKFIGRNQKNFDDGDYAFTVDSCNTGGVSVNSQIRRLTPLECERLQGYPDNWTEGISDTQRYKCLGNAVTVNVIEAIARRLA